MSTKAALTSVTIKKTFENENCHDVYLEKGLNAGFEKGILKCVIT